MPKPLKKQIWRILDWMGPWPQRVLVGPAKGLILYSPFRHRAFCRAEYEPHVLTVLMDLLQPGMVVYDIGAHVGYYTLALAQGVGLSGHVFAFEPLPNHVAALERTLARNDLAQVTVVPEAVGARSGEAQLEQWPNDSMNRIVDDQSVPWNLPYITVPITTLDDWSRTVELKRLDLIKLDVEGYELAALKGGVDTLERFRPAIICEIHRRQDVPYQPDELVEWLQERGYEVILIPSPRRSNLALAGALELLENSRLPAGQMAVVHILAKPYVRD